MKTDIRLRLIILVIIAILPSALFIFYSNSNNKKISEANEIANLKNLTELYSTEHSLVVENARHLLIALSQSPQLNNRYINVDNCNSFLSSLLEKYTRYSNFALTDKNGRVICSAVTSVNNINVSDTLFFEQAINSNGFSIGGYRISKVTNQAVISFGYPTQNSNLIYASIDLNWMNELIKKINTDDEIVVFVLDKNGIVLSGNSRTSIEVGNTFPSQQLINSINKEDSKVVRDKTENNQNYIYAYKKISDVPNTPYIIVGIPEITVHKASEQEFEKQLFSLFGIIIISLVGAWISGTKLILKQVEELSKIDRMKDDFVSLVSHQIRTPLTSIKWFSEILTSKSHGNLTKTQKEFMTDIKKSANNVIGLVGTLLDISRFENNKIKMDPETVSIKKLLKEVVKELRLEIRNKKIELNIEISKRVNLVKVDSKYLKQIYLILISNAIKYSSKFGRVTVTVDQKRTTLMSSIKDSGIGILPTEELAIFERFVRGKNATSHSPEGSGLGLYLAQLIIKNLNGEIYYKKNKPKGAIFSFILEV